VLFAYHNVYVNVFRSMIHKCFMFTSHTPLFKDLCEAKREVLTELPDGWQYLREGRSL